MSKRKRVPWLAIGWMLAALALPVAGWCQEDEQQPETDEETAARHEREDQAEEDEQAAAWVQTYRGLYLQGGGDYAVLTTEGDAKREVEDVANFATPVHTTVDDSWGFGGRLGWRVMKHLAIEGQFELQNRFEFAHNIPSDDTDRTQLRFITATLNAKAYLPMNRFQPYLLLGGGYANANIDPPGSSDDNRHGGAARMGIGTDLYGNENVAIFSEAAYVLPFGDVADFDHVSIGFGLILRFYGE